MNSASNSEMEIESMNQGNCSKIIEDESEECLS